MAIVVASSICVSGPDSASVLSTPHARGDNASGSSRSMARACAACCATNKSWPTRPVCRRDAPGLPMFCLSLRLSYKKIILRSDKTGEQGACRMEPRNAIVTGASHGIGQYIARALAARQMNLLLVARSGAELARLAGELQTDGSKAAVAVVDLGDPSAARQIAEAAGPEPGTVDVPGHNAADEPQH